jgi:hypothetical protein
MVPDTIPLIIRFVVRILPTNTAFGAVPPTNMTSFVGLGTQQSVVFALCVNAFSQQGWLIGSAG